MNMECCKECIELYYLLKKYNPWGLIWDCMCVYILYTLDHNQLALKEHNRWVSMLMGFLLNIWVIG